MDNSETPKTPAKAKTSKPRTSKTKSKAPIEPEPTTVPGPGQWNGVLNTEVCSTQPPQADLEANSLKFVPSSQETEPKVQTDEANALESTPAGTDDNEKNTGNVQNPVTVVDSNYGAKSLESLPLARARDGETKKQCWERLRQEGRAAGMTRRGAIAYAGVEVERLFPPEEPPAPVIVEELPDDSELKPAEPAEPASVSPPAEPVSQKTGEETAKPADLGVAGLGEIPESWPSLPANAQLQIEIAWVTANRLRVRSGNGVDLARALSPAPSYSALSWLETSILFPAKFADISVKATADQDDEKEEIRREKLAIEEIRGILKEMLSDKTP